MGIRPFHPDDLLRLAEIECLCNLTDPLAQFKAVDLGKNWTAHIAASAQFLAKKILEPNCVCWVMTDEQPAAKHNKVEDVTAWAIWTRHATDRPPSNETVHSSSLVEGNTPLDDRYLRDTPIPQADLEDRCHTSVDNTIFDQARIARIKHIIYKLTVPPDAGLTDFWELDGMYVDPRFQRQGLGKQLLQWSVEKARLENMPIVIKSSPVA